MLLLVGIHILFHLLLLQLVFYHILAEVMIVQALEFLSKKVVLIEMRLVYR